MVVSDHKDGIKDFFLWIVNRRDVVGLGTIHKSYYIM